MSVLRMRSPVGTGGHPGQDTATRCSVVLHLLAVVVAHNTALALPEGPLAFGTVLLSSTTCGGDLLGHEVLRC